MGWAYCGKDHFGREIGYGIMATCDKRGCDAVIDRGLGYLCGKMHRDDESGCNMYFCGDHLTGVGPRGGCAHRQAKPYGDTFCQLLARDDNDAEYDAGTGLSWYRHFYCACGKWAADTAVPLQLDEWRMIPGYTDHLATSLLVTDMKESGEEWAYA